MIEKLELCGYFLIVHDIARFAREEGILSQGRGSAANSAVCYALGITAVDPVAMGLLFERFLSEERGEWPDIDIDLPSGDQRERVIQYVFDKYGARGAAMTAVVISYRTRLAVREMGKVLGLGEERVGRLAGLLSSLEHRDDLETPAATLRQAGVDPTSPRIAQLLALVDEVRGLPRHLGQHTGRHRDRRGTPRRGRADRAGAHGRAPRDPVGQGRLRRPRAHQDRPARPRHAGGAGGLARADPRARGPRRSTSRICRRTTPTPTR